MKSVTVRNLTRPEIVPPVVDYCDTFLTQLRGLTFRSSLAEGRGLLLVQGSDSRLNASIHMMFVWMDLAVVWINRNREVVDVGLARRWRPAYIPRHPAQYVLELNASRMGDFQIGDQVSFDETWLD